MPYLTEELVANIPPRPSGFILWDTEVTGFGLRVTPAGFKTFVFQWRLGGRAGSMRRRRIGCYGDVGVAEARRLAGDARLAIERHRAAGTADQSQASRRKRSIPPGSDGDDLENRLIAYFAGRSSSRSRIMSAATRIFIRGDYNANFETIAQEAGVTRPTIYKYFSSKEDLLREVIGAITSETIPVLSIDRTVPPVQALTDFARAFRSVILDERQIALFRLAMVATESPALVYQLATKLSQRRTVDVLTSYLRWGMRTGRLRKADPIMAAESFMAAILGFARTNRFLGLPPKTEQQTERYLRQTAELFVSSLTPQEPRPETA